MGLDESVTRPDATGRFTAEEITTAYAALHQQVQRFVDTHDWTGFADLFTEDAVYVEHAYGEMHGRERIRDWIASTMSAFPGTEMPH